MDRSSFCRCHHYLLHEARYGSITSKDIHETYERLAVSFVAHAFFWPTLSSANFWSCLSWRQLGFEGPSSKTIQDAETGMNAVFFSNKLHAKRKGKDVGYVTRAEET